MSKSHDPFHIVSYYIKWAGILGHTVAFTVNTAWNFFLQCREAAKKLYFSWPGH